MKGELLPIMEGIVRKDGTEFLSCSVDRIAK